MFPDIEKTIVSGFNSYTIRRRKEYRQASDKRKSSISEIYDPASVMWRDKVETTNPDYSAWVESIDKNRATFGLPPMV